MNIQFENISGNASTRGNGISAPAAPLLNAARLNSALPRRGANTSVPSWWELRLQGLAAKETTSRNSLTQFLIDVAAVFAAFLLVAVSCFGFAFSVFAFLFISF